MKNLRNYVQLVGHLGKQPVVTNYQTGKRAVRVSLATHDDYYSAKGEKIINTNWHKLVAWDTKADFLEKYLEKGNLIMINGRLSTRSYEDQEGKIRYITEVIVSEVMKMNQEQRR